MIEVPRDLAEQILEKMVQDTLQINSEWGVSDVVWGEEVEVTSLADLLGGKRWWRK